MKEKFLDFCWRITELLASRTVAILIWLALEIYYGYAVWMGEGNEPVTDSWKLHPATTLTLFITWTAGGAFLLFVGLWGLRKRKK